MPPSLANSVRQQLDRLDRLDKLDKLDALFAKLNSMPMGAPVGGSVRELMMSDIYQLQHTYPAHSAVVLHLDR